MAPAVAAVTREALKRDHPSPWGGLLQWQTARRDEAWQVWRSMKESGPTVPKAPCQVACPAGTDAGRYVGLIGAGRYDDAYAVAAEVNPFPSVCGWICTAPCEGACRRGVLDEPIAIRTLKRFAAEHGQLPPVSPPAIRRDRKGRHRRRRAGRHVGRVLPRAARLSGHGLRSHAGPGRDDGHRHPGLSPAT